MHTLSKILSHKRIKEQSSISGCFRNAVWDWVVSLLTHDYALEVGLRELIERQESELKLKKGDLHNLESFIQDHDTRIKRLTVEMSNHEPGTIWNTLREEIVSLDYQHDAAKKTTIHYYLNFSKYR